MKCPLCEEIVTSEWAMMTHRCGESEKRMSSPPYCPRCRKECQVMAKDMAGSCSCSCGQKWCMNPGSLEREIAAANKWAEEERNTRHGQVPPEDKDRLKEILRRAGLL